MSYVVGFHNKLSLLSSQTTCILFIYDLHISSVDIVTLEFYVALCLVVWKYFTKEHDLYGAVYMNCFKGTFDGMDTGIQL